jgi:signal peptidase I
MDSPTRDEGRCRLAAEALRSWGVVTLRATGVSMLPTLWPGDLLTVQALRLEETEPGEIVLYIRQGRFFIHRVIRRSLTQDQACLVTRGDCMSEDDPPVGRSELLGKITKVQRAGSGFLPARRLSPVRRLLACMFCHWSLFRRVGLRLWNYRSSSDCPGEVTLVGAA